MLWDGKGVPQDRERAIHYWRMAALKGNGRAVWRLWDNLSAWQYFIKVWIPQVGEAAASELI